MRLARPACSPSPRYQMHANQIAAWKKQLLDQAARTFESRIGDGAAGHELEMEKLHAKVGQLIVERDFSRKMSPRIADSNHGELSARRQGQLLRVARSSVYRPRSAANDDDDPALMRRIDELFMSWPFLGSRRVIAMLRVEGHTYAIGIEGLGPKPRTSKPAPGHKIFPYLLRDLFFCLDALQEALAGFGRPEIFDTDQDGQFTSAAFTGALMEADVRISMDGAATGWTRWSSSGSGARSSTGTSTSKARPTAARPAPASLPGSPSTTPVARNCGGEINHALIAHLGLEPRRGLHRPPPQPCGRDRQSLLPFRLSRPQHVGRGGRLSR